MSFESEAERQRRQGLRLAAFILITAGGLMTLLCGACTGVVMISFLSEPGSDGSVILLPLIVGGIPTAAGVFLLVQGFRTLKKLRSGASRSDADAFN
jgi:hypothetical protein